MKTSFFCFSFVLGICGSAAAEVWVPALFGDGMILQQEAANAIWGWAEPGEKVTVTGSWGSEGMGTANEDGKWRVILETPSYGTGHSLKIEGENVIEIGEVAIGEVWLCAGQSNMGWALGNCFGGEEEAATANYPDYRIYDSSREHWHEPLEEQRDRLVKWVPCTPESAATTSAVSYYFGKKLHEELGVPVGIIVQAFAGTPIEGWMPWEIQLDDERAQAAKASLDENARRQMEKQGKTEEKALAEFEAALAEYNDLIDAGETMKNKVKPLAPPIITQPAHLGHQYPAHIFNGMIHPVRPYGIRGMIWYQGERNSKDVPQAAHYREQLAKLIGYYRQSWHELSEGGTDDAFPVFFTQLPSWGAPQAEPVEGLEAPWAVNRESMLRVTEDVPNTGMAVSIDTGDAIQLHPKNKAPIGIRHAYLALKQVYGEDVVDYGPRYRGHELEDGKVVLEFDSVGSGLVAAREGEVLDAFAVAGEDEEWHWAEAVIDGDAVVVSSGDVAEPVAVRYAWAMNPSERNLLYNREGLPASPFRTDNWDLFDPSGEIVEVVKPAKPEGYEDVDWERPEMTQ
ncbi:MAG: sialate O-acetylesterase [Verrucomicrobiota bacterium]